MPLLDADGRIALVGLCLATALGGGLAAALAAGGGFDSTTETQLRSLHRTLLAIAVPAVVLVEGALVYVVCRFTGTESAVQPTESRRLELAWAVGIGLVLLAVGVLSMQALAHPAVFGGEATAGGQAAPEASGDPVAVTVTARQYSWTFRYGESTVRTRDRLVLPADRPVVLRLTSRDVIHALSVPDLAIKRDALPGQTTTVRTTPTATGTYRLYCAEFCGAGHAEMTATVEVVPAAEYDAWLRDRRSAAGRASTPAPGDA